MGMRPAARMPKLTRRSRILIAIALAVIVLLLVGPRLIDAYVDWLWFGELGYRSVFTTVLVTRLVVFLVGGAAGRRHRVRRRWRWPTAPGRCSSRATAQRSGGALPHRGDGPAAAGRHRHPGGDRPAGRHRRADATGCGSSCSCTAATSASATRSSARTSASTRSTCRSTGWCSATCSSRCSWRSSRTCWRTTSSAASGWPGAPAR